MTIEPEKNKRRAKRWPPRFANGKIPARRLRGLISIAASHRNIRPTVLSKFLIDGVKSTFDV